MARNIWPILVLVSLLCQSTIAQDPSDFSKTKDENWADNYLQQDPLSGKEQVTFDDLRQSLADPNQRETVLSRHFERVHEPDVDAKKAFLTEMLEHESPNVKRQAAEELGKLGLLEDVVVQKLLEFLKSDDANLRESAIVALRQMDFGKSAPPEEYWKQLIESLDSENTLVLDSAKSQLLNSGYIPVPILIDALRDSRPKVRHQAAWILSELVGSKKTARIALPGDATGAAPVPTMMAPEPSIMTDIAPSPPKAKIEKESHIALEIEPTKPTDVRVYFGTNRQEIPTSLPPLRNMFVLPVICIVAIFGIIVLWKKDAHAQRQPVGCSAVLITVCLIVAVVVAFMDFRTQVVERGKIGTGIKFGPRRDPDAQVHYGFCDISIPPSHAIGQLESPMFGAEDEEKHVVLKRTEELEENAFFELVKSEVAKRATTERSCFVFIHGFNVTFEKAARRTAQIHHDLHFKGVPIFFSWPSRASVHHYFSDRNEIEYSRYVIKQFLIDVADRVKADRIHVIAHSMGADATCRAIAEMGDRGKVFDQIVLAAPDIDRDVFLKQLIPRMTKTANRTTLYCSRNDFALRLSYTFNDAPRAGDSSRGILVTQEIDTVDASGIDTDLLGHSYYGDCGPILDDVAKLVDEDLAPDQRNLREWPFERDLRYWSFPESETPRPAEEIDKPTMPDNQSSSAEPTPIPQ